MLINKGFSLFYGSDDEFSNHFPCTFMVNDICFNCGEQFLMYAKARLFKDIETAEKILEESRPWAQKALGREVKDFNEDIWNQKSQGIAEAGLWHKFDENILLMASLLDTEGTKIVEASPTDTMWGVGLSIDNPDIYDTKKWRGENRLGNALMRVRYKAISEKKEREDRLDDRFYRY